MIDYTDLIGRLTFRANKLDGPGWLMPNCVADLRDAITLLQHYREGLEGVRDGNWNNEKFTKKRGGRVLDHREYARKTLEGPE